MLEFLVTFVLFYLTVLLIPVILSTFILLKIHKTIWLYCVSLLHPDVEFVKYVTVRTLLDTHRNQGIISVLLAVRGQAQPEAVKRHLQEVASRKDKFGNLAFPRLRHCLVTRCGQYAWQRGKFDLEQNITVSPYTYKGRAITEHNIQECVSETVAKYLPSNIPPWQIIIIPSSEDNHYILLKIHHLLLSEGINIGDLLPLIPPTRQTAGAQPKSPLVQVFRTPKYIPRLKEKLAEDLSNRWNEFISNYDPLERPELLKNTPNLPQFLGICFITFVSLVKECRRGYRVIKSDFFSRTKYTILQTLKETDKRQVNIQVFLLSILVTLDPRNVAKMIFSNVWYFSITLPVHIPMAIYSEFQALQACLTLTYCPYPHTFVGMVYAYVPLLYSSFKEIMSILSILFSAPKTIIQDILMQKESLQTITLCGRKCVAWSDPVKMDVVKTIAKNTNTSEIEVMLCAVSSCISKYFAQTGHPIPEDLPVTIRNINSNYIFATGPNVKPEDAVSGILCLNLPIMDPEKDQTQLENLVQLKRQFNTCLEKQGLSHLLTMLQTKFGILTKFMPATVLSIYLKYLSRKYAVSLTEVTNRYPNVTQKTLWGQEVNNAIYWRPPQANTCISLCLNEYADHVRLAVMCDAQLVPHHPYLSRGFPEFIQDLHASSNVK